MSTGIGIDSFSYHRFFGDIGPTDQPSSIRWTARDFLSRAHELGVDAVSLQTTYLPELDPDIIASLGRQLNEFGLEVVLAWGHPSGLENGDRPEKAEAIRRLLPVAKTLGCSLLRFVTGNFLSFKFSAPERIERLTPIIRDITTTAADYDLTLAIENHGDFAMKDLLELVEGVDMKNLGICFDAMNAVRVGDDLMEAAAMAATYIRMVHVRDHLPLSESPVKVESFWPSAPLGHGQLDIEGVIRFLEADGYAGNLFIEMGYMHPDFSDEDAAVAESVAYLKKTIQNKGEQL
ncbi:MAG: sugar phosphate isomerase/epimerase [Deltaproteobacteria bacterium]|nr:sugar phosphate isomerase/epimerase [Deltaproteobacteria bacterium]